MLTVIFVFAVWLIFGLVALVYMYGDENTSNSEEEKE